MTLNLKKMKKIVWFFMVIGLFLNLNSSLNAQPNMKNGGGGKMMNKNLVETNDVPQVVKDSQQRLFPGTTVEKWFIAERGNKGNQGNGKGNQDRPEIFVARFKDKEGFITHCRIKESGEIKGSMTMLQGEKGLPQNIKDAVLKRFPGYKIQASQRVYHAKNNQKAYRVVLQQNSTKIITFTDENGNEIKEDKLAPELKENIIETPDKQ